MTKESIPYATVPYDSFPVTYIETTSASSN